MKQLLLLVIFCLSIYTLSAQEKYEKFWKEVTRLESEGNFKSAARIVDKIRQKAQNTNASDQIIKSFIYHAKFISLLEENAHDKIISSLEESIKTAPFPTNQILQSIYASCLDQYFKNNKYFINKRSEQKSSEVPDNFKIWTANTFVKRIVALYESSIKNPDMLQKIPIQDYAYILTESNKSTSYRPTLYDFLAHRALDFLKTMEDPAILYKPALLAETKEFEAISFSSSDTAVSNISALKLFQKLEAIHYEKDTLAYIDIVLERLKFVENHSSVKEKDSLYLNALQTLLENYLGHEAATRIGLQIVDYWWNQSKAADAKYNTNFKDNRIKALALCKRLIALFPNTADATIYLNLIKKQLLSKKLSLQTNRFVVPQKPFLMQLTYKNTDSIYITAYKVSYNDFKGNIRLTKDSIVRNLLRTQQPIINKLFKLPVKDDLYEYTTEIDIPPLPAGKYILVASGSPDCKLLSKIYAYASIQVTPLSLLIDENANDMTLQLLHRESGVPIEGATVNTIGDKGFRAQGKTNAMGMFALERKMTTEIKLNTEIVYKNDTLFTKNILYKKNKEEDEHITIAKLFLDRSIYRPGQTLYFKGILVEKNKEQKKVVPNTWVNVIIYDANDEELQSFHLKTNNYGSVNGEYTLPKNVRTGTFTIELKEGYNEKENKDAYRDEIYSFYPGGFRFRVEEYKRPRFEVKLEKITQAYRLGDSILVTGKAKAFFGAAISSGKVNYSVERVSPFDNSWEYNDEPEKVLEGNTETDASGNFSITFFASPQFNEETHQNLSFIFEVFVEVTDINGETCTNQTTFKIGAKSIKASLFIKEKITNDEEQLITVTTKNLNDQEIAADVKLEIYKLKTPERLLLPKTWDIVDLPYLSKEDFIKQFPHEVYDSTDLKTHWPKIEKVFYSTFNTSIKDTVQLKSHKNWKPGTYAVKLTATSKQNDTFETTRYFELYRKGETPLKVTKNIFEYEIANTKFKKDGYVLLHLKTAAEKLNVFIKASYKTKNLLNKHVEITNGRALVKIPVKPEYENSIELEVYFVRQNHLFQENFIASFSKENHKLNFETLSFRNRLLPDANENWSFKITNLDNKKVAAEVLASMYDESLDVFKKHEWYSPDDLSLIYRMRYRHYEPIDQHYFFENQDFRTFLNDYYFEKFSYKANYEQLKWFGFNFNKSEYSNETYLTRLRKTKPVKSKNNIAVGYISGIVSDAYGPLAGASVVQLGTSYNNTHTDFDGNYEMDVPVGTILGFSYSGYKPEVIIVQEPGEIINIILEQYPEALDEIVVIGYGNRTYLKPLQKETAPGRKLLDQLGEKASTITISYIPLAKGISQKMSIRARDYYNNPDIPLFIVDGEIVPVTITSGIDITTDMIEQITVLKGAKAISIYGEKAKNGAVTLTTKQGLEALLQTETRTNLKETAFFFPNLTTNARGEIQFNFKAPQALTKWKLMMLGHTKDLKTGGLTKTVITNKNLNVVPNYPRFVREKDTLVFSAKLSNLTNEVLTGTAALQIADAFSMRPLAENIKLSPAVSNFNIDANGNTEVFWKLAIPEGITAIQFKVVAKAGQHSDGEAKVIPVLSNRILITESQPLWVPAGESRETRFNKLILETSETRKHHNFTIEYTSNPAWLALKSLPYLMEFPYECAEQTFSRFYANSIAAHIVDSNPKIKDIFENWRQSDTTKSILQKNEELKNIMLAETPWVKDALSEAQNKSNLAALFETVEVEAKQKQALDKLQKLQSASGGFPWFAGGWENTFITQHILAGFGHLAKLNISLKENTETDKLIKKGIGYLDSEFLKNHKRLLNKKEFKATPLSTSDIHYLYTRSFFLNTYPLSKELESIWPEYIRKAKENWLSQPLYQKGLIALVLNRTKETEMANAIMESLKQQAVITEESGMYWKGNTGSWYWYRAPIETQALLIEAFTEIKKDKETIEALKMWLLKNKRTQSWRTTKATTEAIYALLMQGSEWLSVKENTVISLGNQKIKSQKLEAIQKEAGTGYFKLKWKPKEISGAMGIINVQNKSEIPGFGGAYWQYFEDLDKVKANDDHSPLSIKKQLFLKDPLENGGVLKAIDKTTSVKIGDLITVKMEITTKEDLEFVHLKDMRASGLEPVDVLSRYKWQDGLGYYQSTKDAATHFFFDKLPKGSYVFEYQLRANNSGSFLNGICTLQSMYAPEFAAQSKAVRIQIDK